MMWSYGKQPIIALSSTKAKYSVLTNGAKQNQHGYNTFFMDLECYKTRPLLFTWTIEII
jgi:hypothetical protein